VRQPQLPRWYATARIANIQKRQLRLPHSKLGNEATWQPYVPLGGATSAAGRAGPK
jgi:hypothetical protein